MNSWKLSETSYHDVKDRQFEVAVLPFGATEPHNLHLPYGTDTFEASLLADMACENASAKNARIVRLPTVPYGTQTNQKEFPLSMNLNPSTLGLIVKDLVGSLEGSGIKKLLLLNSHGGNSFKSLLRELYGKTTVHIFLCDWYANFSKDIQQRVFDEPGDHAGEMETAMALAYFGEFVEKDAQGNLLADEGAVRSPKLNALKKGWIATTRPWHLLTTNTGVGNPHAATAEKGQQFVEEVVERIANFLVELSQLPINESFPY